MFNFFSRPPSAPPSTKLYDTLGLAKDSTQNEIKSTYRTLAMKHHPDKGGCEDTFKKNHGSVRSVVESRKTPPLRHIRHHRGQRRRRKCRDLFASMFSPSSARIAPIIMEVQTSLEELYSEIERPITCKVRRSCKPCSGAGGTDIRVCTACKGRGVLVKL